MSSSPNWRFRKMQEGEINIDPYEGEFFTTEALGSLNDVLVREAVQNSLDAKLPDSKAHLRIFLSHGPESLESSDRDRYLKELFPHLRSKGSGLASPPADGEPFDYLVLEDFGTRGLRGDPRQIEDVEGEGGVQGTLYGTSGIAAGRPAGKRSQAEPAPTVGNGGDRRCKSGKVFVHSR